MGGRDCGDAETLWVDLRCANCRSCATPRPPERARRLCRMCLWRIAWRLYGLQGALMAVDVGQHRVALSPSELSSSSSFLLAAAAVF